jgi:hypothetical protein
LKPSWQTGVGVPADGWRDVPDVSLTAAGHDGYMICMTGGYYTVGGTSASTPSFAGLMALTAQKTGARLGNANPSFYTLAANQASGGAAVFHDITIGNNSVPGLAGYAAGVGYDMATGLGSVDASVLVNNWGGGSVSTPSFQLSASPTSISMKQGASAAASITVSPKSGFSSAVGLSASGLPSGVTATFSPTSVSGGSGASLLTLNATAQAAAATASITINASGGGVTQSLTLPVTITGCSYSISPTSASPAATAASYSVQVATSTGCTWTAVSNVNWTAVTSGASGSGSGTVGYSVAANTATSSRSGAISIAGLSLGVTQAAAAPQFSLGATSATVGATASTGSVSVTASSPTSTWTAVSNATWIAITSGASSSGSKTVGYSVAANTSAARTGTMTIAGLTFTVNQAGSACSYSLNPTGASLTAASGAYTVQVTATSGCAWTAASNAGWITVTSGSSETGAGTVNYSVTANSATSARSGSITIAGSTFTVTQAASAGTSGFTLNPSSASLTASAQTGSVMLTSSSASASWTSSNSSNWITITNGSSGTGSRSIAYSVTANASASPRTASLTIAGLTFTITQAGPSCSYSLNPTSATVASSAGTYTVKITTTAGCAYTSTSSANWISVTSGASGTGSGTITYTVVPNTASTARDAAIVSGGAVLSILQVAPTPPYILNPSSASYAPAAVTGTVVVSETTGNSSWTAVSNASWIAVTSGASSSGNGRVGYSVAANNTSSTRTGTITIAGLPFEIMQGPGSSSCSYSLNPTSASIVAAAETYNVLVTTGPGCSWTAVSNSSFLYVMEGASGSGTGLVVFGPTPNTGAARTGSLTIAGINFPVSQAGASAGTAVFSLSASTASIPATAVTGTVGLTASSPTAPWTAVSQAPWLTITKGASGVGSGAITYAIAANNTSNSRMGLVMIAGLPYTVTQAGVGCNYGIGAATVGQEASGFTLSFPVTANTGCTWTASSNSSWMTLLSGSPGSGNGTVVFNASAYTGAARSATLTIAGFTVTISQGGN